MGVDALALVALVFADFLDAFFEDVRFLAVAVEDAPAVAAPASAVDSALADLLVKERDILAGLTPAGRRKLASLLRELSTGFDGEED